MHTRNAFFAALQEQTGQSFFIENKAGATSTIGAMSVVQAAPDGYTLVANDTTYALLPHIFKKLPFDHEKDLQPIAAFVFAPMAVVAARRLSPLIASNLTFPPSTWPMTPGVDAIW